MDRLNSIIAKSKLKAQPHYEQFTRMGLGKFIQDNHLARYMLYGIILVKMASIYDKLKQVVAINNIYSQLIQDEKKNMKSYFKDQDMMQDIITKRILEQNKFIEDEAELSEGIKYTPSYRGSASM